MGVYNEVYKKCPKCKDGYGYCQIGAVYMGSTGFFTATFRLDSLESLVEQLDEEGLRELHSRLEDQDFVCGSDPMNPEGCGHSFRINDSTQNRLAIAKELFG